MIPFSIWYTKVLYTSINEFLPKLPLKLRIFPVRLRLGSHVIAVLDLLFFGLAESLEVFLQATGLFGCAEAQELGFGLFR